MFSDCRNDSSTYQGDAYNGTESKLKATFHEETLPLVGETMIFVEES